MALNFRSSAFPIFLPIFLIPRDPPELKPICTIQVFDRLIEAVHGIPIPGARHGYIVFFIFGEQWYFEGQNAKGVLKAVGPTVLPLRDDHPESNRLDGEKSGPEVCAWFGILAHDVEVVNSVNIKYHGFGPNSSSVLRYMLKSLPDTSWFHMPFMIGYGSRLPGIE